MSEGYRSYLDVLLGTPINKTCVSCGMRPARRASFRCEECASATLQQTNKESQGE